MAAVDPFAPVPASARGAAPASAAGAAGGAAPRPPALSYPQLLRGRTYRPWKPLLGLLLVVGLLVVAAIVSLLTYFLVQVLSGNAGALDHMVDNPVMTPGLFLATNISLALAIPVGWLGIRAVHGYPIGFLSSVVGRFRWAWFGRCLLVLAPLWVVYLAVASLGGGTEGLGGRAEHWVALLVITILTTPLQAAGEEFFFRGSLTQAVGAWCRGSRVAFLVGLVVSAPLFAAAHGSRDLWVFLDLAVFACAASYLTWRTGGLEAAIALHIVNNLLAIGLSIFLGGFESGFVSEDTTGSPVQVLVSLVVTSIAVALVLWQARRGDITRVATDDLPPPRGLPQAPGHPGYLGGYPQPGDPQYSQQGHLQPGYPQQGYPQQGYPQPGYQPPSPQRPGHQQPGQPQPGQRSGHQPTPEPPRDLWAPPTTGAGDPGGRPHDPRNVPPNG